MVQYAIKISLPKQMRDEIDYTASAKEEGKNMAINTANTGSGCACSRESCEGCSCYGVSQAEQNNERNTEMNEQDFTKLAKSVVAAYAEEHLDKTDKGSVTEEDVYIVWMCKTLQNNKALLSTTMPDGMYYEFTYNGDKRMAYLDAYKKFENRVYVI